MRLLEYIFNLMQPAHQLIIIWRLPFIEHMVGKVRDREMWLGCTTRERGYCRERARLKMRIQHHKGVIPL
jgi:hypothetical protein